MLTLGGSWAGGWRRLAGVPVDSVLSDDARAFGRDSRFWLLPSGHGLTLDSTSGRIRGTP